MNIVSNCCPEICLYTHRLIQRSVLINHKWHISGTALLPKALENVTEEGWEDSESCGVLRKTMLQCLLDDREGLLYSQTTVTRSSQSTFQPGWRRLYKAPPLSWGRERQCPGHFSFSSITWLPVTYRKGTHLRTGPGTRNSFQLPNLQQGHSQNCSLGSCPRWPLSISFSHYLMFLQMIEGPRGEMAQVTREWRRDVSPEWGRTLLLCQHM